MSAEVKVQMMWQKRRTWYVGRKGAHGLEFMEYFW